MAEVALVAAAIAAVALVIVCVRAYLLLAQAEAALRRLDKLVDTDLRTAVHSVARAAQGVQRAAGKLAEGIEPLNACLCRADRVSERLEPDLLAVSMIQPAITRMSSWLDGVRKGLSDIRGRRPRRPPPGGGIDTEAG